MRHKYDTHGIVLSRAPLGEANALITLITPSLGLVRARAQSVRRPGAKLAAALTTFTESSVVLVRGNEGWRIAGAVLEDNWFAHITRPQARAVAARVSGLVVRLVAGDVHEAELFPIIKHFLEALTTLPEQALESAEIVAALRVLSALGLDAGTIPGEPSDFTLDLLTQIHEERTAYISRVNQGLLASGL